MSGFKHLYFFEVVIVAASMVLFITVSAFSQAREITNSIGMKFRLIPAGEFMMGVSPGDGDPVGDESPRHRVEITRAFYMGVTEVTQGQWQRVMGSNPSYFKGDSSRPVEGVSWNDAVDFCRRLSQMTGESNRLPTEAEWEYACRAGTTTRFYWGDSSSESVVKQYAWYEKNADDGYWTSPHASREGTQPVGGKRPNGWGLYDVSGNVWEWCSDWYGYDYYSSSPSRDPGGPRSGSARVLRGGCWLLYARNIRSSFRDWGTPDFRGNCLGFRLVRDEQ